MLAEILSKMETLSPKEVSQGDTRPGPSIWNRDAALQDTEVGLVLPVPTSARSSVTLASFKDALLSSIKTERPGLGRRAARAGPCPQCPLVADLPAACTDARPPAPSSCSFASALARAFQKCTGPTP